MDTNEINLLTEQATAAYSNGDLQSSFIYGNEALIWLRQMPPSMDYLNILTLLQTTCAYLGRTKDCCDLEPEIKSAIYTLIPENTQLMYLIHLLDYSSQLFFLRNVSNLKELLSLLTDECEQSGFSKEQIDLS